MKKILTLLAVTFASMTVAHAQFGIIAGLNYSGTKYTPKTLIDEAKNITLFHFGVGYKLDLPFSLVLQPEITYQMKGARLEAAGAQPLDYKNGYLEAGVGIQWGPDLLIARPFLVAQPYIGYMVYPDSSLKDITSGTNKLETGIGLGVGVEALNHFQLSVMWFRNLGTLADNIQTASTASVLSKLTDLKSYQGVRVSLMYLF